MFSRTQKASVPSGERKLTHMHTHTPSAFRSTLVVAPQQGLVAGAAGALLRQAEQQQRALKVSVISSLTEVCLGRARRAAQACCVAA